MILAYTSQKKEASLVQQEKAFMMLQSRKRLSVKALAREDNNQTYVKAVIKKSHGTLTRPATILFDDQVPGKAHCICPVGTSGLCCHVLALLLFRM